MVWYVRYVRWLAGWVIGRACYFYINYIIRTTPFFDVFEPSSSAKARIWMEVWHRYLTRVFPVRVSIARLELIKISAHSFVYISRFILATYTIKRSKTAM